MERLPFKRRLSVDTLGRGGEKRYTPRAAYRANRFFRCAVNTKNREACTPPDKEKIEEPLHRAGNSLAVRTGSETAPIMALATVLRSASRRNQRRETPACACPCAARQPCRPKKRGESYRLSGACVPVTRQGLERRISFLQNPLSIYHNDWGRSFFLLNRLHISGGLVRN